MTFKFEEYRRFDRTIDLVAFSRAHYSHLLASNKGVSFLKCIEDIHKISSRQAAAIAIATSEALSFDDM